MSLTDEARVLAVILILLVVVTLASSAPGGRSSLFDAWSREDMVEIAGYGEEKLSTVVVSGSVTCESGSDDQKEVSPRRLWPIHGASVAVQCGSSRSGHDTTTMVTDESGYFAIDLPSELHAATNLESDCWVKVLKLPNNSECASAFIQKHKQLKLTSSKNGVRSFSVGEIRFQNSSDKSTDASFKRTIVRQNHGEQFIE